MTSPTLRCAVVQLGGTDRLARAMLPCGDRPFLAWIMRELCRYGVERVVLLSGNADDDVVQAIPAATAHLPKPLEISHMPGRLFEARTQLPERFLFCQGDCWLDINLAPFLAEAAQGNAAGHALHGSGLSVLTQAAFAPGGAPDLPITRLPGNVYDLTDPGDAARAKVELPQRLRRRALFLDRDGVINHDHGYVGSPERFAFVDGARAAIKLASDAGWHVFVVTNQSGIARGFYSEADFVALMAWVDDEVRRAGGNIDDLRYCPMHPEAKLEEFRGESDWRKPNAGMLIDLIFAWDLDPAAGLMVGDQPTDIAAAKAAGMPGHLVPGGNLHDFIAPLLN